LTICQDFLQFRQGQVGTSLQRLEQASLGGLIDPAHRPVTWLDALGLPILPVLPAHLLHPTQTHSKKMSELSLTALVAGISVKKLAAQIVFVGSRHRFRGSARAALY